MKNFITLTAMALCLSVTVQAQWVKTNFPTSMPNDMYITSDGRIIVGEYSKMYSDEGAGGIYMSDDNGDTWQIADIANYNYTVFLEADGYFYAFGEDAKIARTKDFEDWEIMDYKFLYDTEELLLDCYAAVYYNGRIYCAPFGSTPAYTENFGEKWLTDVTEMKYGVSSKAYLSAILDLGDKSIVSFVIGHSNNNALVFETFDIAHEQHPDAKPIFHSDRGSQYTSEAFRSALREADA